MQRLRLPEVNGFQLDANPALGFQIGSGLQMNKNFALTLAYTTVSHPVSEEFKMDFDGTGTMISGKVKGDIEIKGFELAVIGNF